MISSIKNPPLRIFFWSEELVRRAPNHISENMQLHTYIFISVKTVMEFHSVLLEIEVTLIFF